MQPQYPYPQQVQQPYPAQQPPMPQYPPATYPPQQTYAAPGGYAQYAPPAPQQPAAPPPPPGTLDQFYSQPSGGGGPAFKFMDASRQPQIGKSYEGFVARPVTDSDIRAQTDQQGQPQKYRDGRIKYVMVVPMQVQPSQEFPDGVAGWWVKGQARDELARAMAEAGASAGPPEHGAYIRVTLAGVRPVPNMNPAYQYRVEYRRPAGALPGGPVEQHDNPSAPVQAFPPPVVPAPQPQYAPPAQYGAGPQAQNIQAPPQPVQQVPHYAPPAQQPMQQIPVPTGPAPASTPVPVAPQTAPHPVAAAQPAQMPAGLNPEQQKLFEKLLGQQQAAPTA